MTSHDFSYRALVAFPLTSLTSLELKIRVPEYLFGSYCTNSNTPFAIKLSISCRWDSSNGFPGVVIIPSCHSFMDSSILACSLLIMNAMEVLIPLLIAVVNCSSKSLLIGHLQLQLPLRMVIAGQILLRDPGSHPWPQY
jgi:hypothetical protein